MTAQEVRAELPASVVAVIAAVGDDLGTSDPLVLLDSMKMEIPVLAETAGTVTSVDVAVGDVIQQGDLIAVVS